MTKLIKGVSEGCDNIEPVADITEPGSNIKTPPEHKHRNLHRNKKEGTCSDNGISLTFQEEDKAEARDRGTGAVLHQRRRGIIRNKAEAGETICTGTNRTHTSIDARSTSTLEARYKAVTEDRNVGADLCPKINTDSGGIIEPRNEVRDMAVTEDRSVGADLCPKVNTTSGGIVEPRNLR